MGRSGVSGNKSIKVGPITAKLIQSQKVVHLKTVREFDVAGCGSFENLTEMLASKNKTQNSKLAKFIKEYFLELNWSSLHFQISINLINEAIIRRNECLQFEKSRLVSLISNFSKIGIDEIEDSKLEFLFSVSMALAYFHQQGIFTTDEVRPVFKGLKSTFLKIVELKNVLIFKAKQLKPLIEEASVPPKSIRFPKNEVPKKLSCFSEFTEEADRNSSPIIQTFPSESFKKSPTIISRRITIDKNSHQRNPQKAHVPKNPRLVIRAPEPTLQFTKTKSQVPLESKDPYDKTSLKFPDPKELVGCSSEGYSFEESSSDQKDNWSNKEDQSVDSVVFPELGSPSKETHGRSPFRQQPHKFFNSKTNCGSRKMTCEAISPKNNRKTLASVSGKSETELYVKVEHKNNGQSNFADNKIICQVSPIPESPVNSVVSVQSQSICSKNSGFRIEKMVSPGSINSAIESLVGKAVVETVDQLKTHANTLNVHRLNIKTAIGGILESQFPTAKIEVKEYGSFATGLLTPYSDMDLCLLNTGSVNRVEANIFLAELLPFLGVLPQIVCIKHIETASIPVLKIIIQVTPNEEMHVDLTVETTEERENGSTAFRTTAFITDCIRAYPSFKPVVLFVKYVLNLGGLSDSYKGILIRGFERVWLVCVVLGFYANQRTAKRDQLREINPPVPAVFIA